MHSMGNVESILSSAGIAAIVSAVASYLINLLMQKRKYKDDYYKMVIQKRMEAYANIENLCKLLKTTTTCTKTHRQFCICFENIDSLLRLCVTSALTLANNVWITQNLCKELYELNELLVRTEEDCFKNGVEVKNVGVELYEEIKARQIRIEKLYIKDILNLYDVKHFLKSKDIKE